MFKVNISNASQNLSWSASFPTELEAQEWLAKQIGKPHRLPERIVSISDDYIQEDVLEVIESEVEHFDAEGNSLGMIIEQTHVRLKSQFTSEIIDITAEINLAQLKEDAKKFLQESDWKVLRHRDQIEAGIPTSLTKEEYQALLIERQAKRDLI